MTKTHLIAFVAILLVAGSAFGAYSGGNGTVGNPYSIATKADLLALAANTADYGKCFILTADIDLGGKVFTTAIITANNSTSADFQGTAFNGTFNGNGHKITHFKVNGGYSYLGFFGQNNGFVKNLGLENFSVIGNGSLYTSNCCIGGFAGENDGSIINCYSTGTVSGSNYSEVGGLVGNNYGSIVNCYSTGSVSGLAVVGGLAGMNDPGNIINCYSTGKISGGPGSYCIGGLIGFNVVYSNIISGNFWNTQTSGTSFGVGFSLTSGVTGKTTVQMKTESTFTNERWDFTGETANGTDDIWAMPSAGGYPILAWQKDTMPLLPPFQVKKCSVTAGSKYSSDTISFSGTMNPTDGEISAASEIVVTVDSNDMVNPCIMTFPINAAAYKKGVYNYTLKTGVSQSSFKFSTKSNVFSFSAKSVDLSGLGCPVTIEVEIGDFNTAIDIDEIIVNGPKVPMPILLMMDVRDVLMVDKCTVKQNNKKPNSDQLTVKGAFAVEDANVNMNVEEFAAALGTQTFTLPIGSFNAKGANFICSKVHTTEVDGGTASATFNFNLCSFILTIKNANIPAVSGDVDFGITFADFNEVEPVTLP